MSRVSEPFPSPPIPADSRTEVFLRYLDFFRSRVTAKIQAMPDAELRTSRLPSGWTPLELVKHLRYVELRWLVWGFEGRDVGDPWGDRDGAGRPARPGHAEPGHHRGPPPRRGRPAR